jgi:hypothetical protein
MNTLKGAIGIAEEVVVGEVLYCVAKLGEENTLVIVIRLEIMPCVVILGPGIGHADQKYGMLAAEKMHMF